MIRGTRTRTWTAALCLASLACGPGDPGDGVARHAAPATALPAREAVRIGSVEGSGPDVFGRVDALALDAYGRVHVLDGLAQEIRVFDAEGRHVRSYGAQGEGPGELTGATGLAVAPDGSTWVWDPRQQRLSVFDSSGTFRETHARQWRSFTVPWRGLFMEDGTLLDVGGRYDGLEPGSGVTHRFRQVTWAVRHDARAQPVDTLAPVLDVPRTAFQGNFIVPFESSGLAVWERDGSAWVAEGATYGLVRVGAAGDTLVRVQVDAPSVPVSQAERDSAAATYPRRPGREGLDPSLIPEFKPAVADMVRMGGGWVAVFPQLAEGTGRMVDVFDEQGGLRGRVDLGLSLLLPRGRLAFHDGLLWGVALNDFDVPFVVALDLGVGH